MGIIYNPSVKETELYSAYGYTVSGKANRYEWTYDGSGREEDCYINITIADAYGHVVFSHDMGNNAILEGTFNRHIDNFLWWIANENPSDYDMENTLYKVLVRNSTLFSYQIENRKAKQRREETEQKAIAERQRLENEQIEKIQAYCDQSGFILYRSWKGLYIFRVNYNTEQVTQALKKTIQADNTAAMDHYIEYAERYPENEITIVFSGEIENAMQFIKLNKKTA